MTQSEPVALPELPAPLIDIGADLFTADQMREYVLADRNQRTPAVALAALQELVDSMVPFHRIWLDSSALTATKINEETDRFKAACANARALLARATERGQA